MGAAGFVTTGSGDSAEEAFRNAKEDAFYEYGHGGYTGTIAEKGEVEVLTHSRVPEGVAEEYAGHLLARNDPRICDKWGPAGAIPLDDGRTWLFVGWASS
ncbi:hypothetical protein ACH4PU_30805 [Streptomyces sp. NPDC021100]|uniref:hypothetical protein n=1 Tax=Streptomyces sp. NPDC021100 TaxID=3365114 RepID=UPI00379B272A